MNKDIFPRVTAILCTGLPQRERLATAAVRSFYNQNYPNRDILIFNHSKGEPYEYRLTSLLPEPPEGVLVREIMVNRFPTLGHMRSAALDRLDEGTKFVVQWDDDDWSHPTRITRQMNYLKASDKPGACCVLGSQVRYSLPHNTAFMHVNKEDGIAGTILHPNDGNRYQAEHGTEDSTFLKEHYLGHDKHVVLVDREQPELYLRFFHSGNLCAESHVMKVYSQPQWHGCWVSDTQEGGYLPPTSRAYLLNVLAEEYGLERLFDVIQHVRCTKCNKQYAGEISYRGRGASRQPIPPHRWRRIWFATQTDAVTPFEGICRKCA